MAEIEDDTPPQMDVESALARSREVARAVFTKIALCELAVSQTHVRTQLPQYGNGEIHVAFLRLESEGHIRCIDPSAAIPLWEIAPVLGGKQTKITDPHLVDSHRRGGRTLFILAILIFLGLLVWSWQTGMRLD